MLTNAQLSEISRDAQIAYALGKVPSFELAFARGVEAAATAEARALALSEAYDLLFDVKGCKATRFDAQTAIRNLAAPADVDAWVDLARAAKSKNRTLISEDRTSNTDRAWLGEAQKGDGHHG